MNIKDGKLASWRSYLTHEKRGDISSDVPLIRMQNAGAIVDAMLRDQLAGLQTRGSGEPCFLLP